MNDMNELISPESRQKLRRSVTLGCTYALAAAFVLPGIAVAASAPAGAPANDNVMIESVKFPNGTITMAGNIYTPKNSDKHGNTRPSWWCILAGA